MPKKLKKKISKQRIEKRIVEVRSRAYGVHLRVARGSKKPATLNTVLTAHAARTADINRIASEVHNALKLYSDFFKESMFWQAILSKMRKANTNKPAALFNAIEGMELNSKYPLSRFGNIPMLRTSFITGKLHVSLYNTTPPHIKSKDTAYCYELIALFFTAKGKLATHDIVTSSWVSKKEAVSQLNFDFKQPRNSRLYLLCLRLHTGVNETATDTLASQGMMVVRAGDKREVLLID